MREVPPDPEKQLRSIFLPRETPKQKVHRQLVARRLKDPNRVKPPAPPAKP